MRHLIKWLAKLVNSPCLLPGLTNFFPVQSGPFQHKHQRPAAHGAVHHRQRLDIDLNLFALIDGMEMWRRMIAVKHADDDSLEPAQFGHDNRLVCFNRLTWTGGHFRTLSQPAPSFFIAGQRGRVGHLIEDFAEVVRAATLGAGLDVVADFPGGKLGREGERNDLIEGDAFAGRGIDGERGQIIGNLCLDRFHVT